MTPTVAAMVQVQRLTGMRPSEVCRMVAGDIDTTRDPELWYYVPGKHKTEEYIGKKAIPLGKPEQKLIAPYLEGKKPTEAVFSPRTAMQEWNSERRANRKTKIQPSQQERNQRRAENHTDRIGEFYDRDSYRQAVEYAIRKGNKVLPEGKQSQIGFLNNSAPLGLVRFGGGLQQRLSDGLFVPHAQNRPTLPLREHDPTSKK